MLPGTILLTTMVHAVETITHIWMPPSPLAPTTCRKMIGRMKRRPRLLARSGLLLRRAIALRSQAFCKTFAIKFGELADV